MYIQPTGQHLEQLQAALLDAFDNAALTRLVRYGLELDLEWVTPVQGKRDLTTIVDELIAHCASQPGGLKRLLAAACAQNPNNHQLATLASEWDTLEFTTIPLPENHSSLQTQQREVMAGSDINESLIVTGDGNMVQQIDTGGGINIQGNVEAGNDFIGGTKLKAIRSTHGILRVLSIARRRL